MVPATKDRPFCGHWVVSRGVAVSYRGAKCTKKYYLVQTRGGHIRQVRLTIGGLSSQGPLYLKQERHTDQIYLKTTHKFVKSIKTLLLQNDVTKPLELRAAVSSHVLALLKLLRIFKLILRVHLCGFPDRERLLAPCLFLARSLILWSCQI